MICTYRPPYCTDHIVELAVKETVTADMFDSAFPQYIPVDEPNTSTGYGQMASEDVGHAEQFVQHDKSNRLLQDAGTSTLVEKNEAIKTERLK